MNIDWNVIREVAESSLPAIFGLLGTVVGGTITERVQRKTQKRQFEESRKDCTRDKMVTLVSEAKKWIDTIIVLIPILPGLDNSEISKVASSELGEDLKASGLKVDQALQYLLFYVRDQTLRQKLVEFRAMWEQRLDHTTGPLVENPDSKNARETALQYVGAMRRCVNEIRNLAEETLSVTVSSESC